MLIPVPPLFRKRRRLSAKTNPPAALALVSAEYSPGSSIQLNFNQAINIAGLIVAQITIKDGPVIGAAYQGVGSATMVGTNAVLIGLDETGSYTGADVLLTATASNGIVAADDAEAWAGVTDYVVPA